MVNFGFNNPPLDNIAFLMSKKGELHFDYDEIKFEAHQRAFTVAKVTQIDLLSDIQTSLENAFVEGQSFEKWKKELKPTLQKHGWLGKVVVQNPDTKEQKEIFVGASRLKKIFYTNTRTAYQQSRARAQEQSSDEYLRYVAILDSRTRHTHAALHGLILKKKDPFWEKNYPPNGWNCRCRVDSYSKDDLDEFGFKESSPAQKLNIAEKDWDYDTRNLEKNDNALQLIIENKLKRLAKNKSAVNALNALKAEIKAKRQRYEDMRVLWNATNSKEKRSLGKIGGILGQIMPQTKEKEISINTATIKRHKKKHPEITAFDYSIVPYMLNDEAILGIFKDFNGKGDEIFIIASKMGIQYRLALLNATNGVYVKSLASNERDGRDIYSKLKRNKEKVWLKEEVR